MTKVLNKERMLAEFLGILLGDGNLNKNSNCITIVGSLEESYYYSNYVIPLIKNLFDVDPKLRRRNDRNAIYIDFCSKETMEYLSKDIGLVRGNKCKAYMPSIMKDNTKLIPHFLRGLFDTDGCLKFSKQSSNKNYYPRIRIALSETSFSKEVKELLQKMNFNLSVFKDSRFNGLVCYEISGKENLERWIKEIGTNNPVHKTKYLVWKRFGSYITKSSLKERLEALNLNTLL